MSSLLTVDQLRAYIPDTADDDDTLEQRLNDTEAELERRFGPATSGSGDEVTEVVYAAGRTMAALRQEPATITSVVDNQAGTEVELEQDDPAGYRVRDNYLVREVGAWGRYTTVTYTPIDDSAARRRVVVKLIQLDMAYTPGLGSQSGGPWSESYAGKRYQLEREDIIASLGGPELFA